MHRAATHIYPWYNKVIIINLEWDIASRWDENLVTASRHGYFSQCTLNSSWILEEGQSTQKYLLHCHGWLKDWTKVQHGKRTFELYLKITPTKGRTKKQPWSFGLCALNNYKVNFPQNRWGKRVPKYGSQSVTTIDSCLWLRTIPGQDIEIQNIEKRK